MFSYFGSKCILAKKYPEPIHDVVIEPFAGAAWYSLLYCSRQVLLCDIDPIISGIWNWIIQATPKDIESLPELSLGQKLSDVRGLSVEERNLLGFCCGKGRGDPGNQVTGWADRYPLMTRLKKRLRYYVPRIRHWKVINRSYSTLVNRQATWFIDPPYMGAGIGYQFNDVDYQHLATWCKSRKGQVIVCEGREGNWLPFQPLDTKQTMGARYRIVEKVWTNSKEKQREVA